MRPSVLAEALAFGLIAAACSAASPSSWQKPGADQQKTASDSAVCRDRAQADALARYPYRGASAAMGPAGIVRQQQNDDADRATWEAARFNDCMRDRGYQLSR